MTDLITAGLAAIGGAAIAKIIDYAWKRVVRRQESGEEAETMAIVEPRIEALRNHMDDRFDALSDERRSGDAKLHEKLDETRKELGLLDKRQTELEGKVSADSGRLGQIEHQLGRIDRKLDAITDRLIDIAGGH